MASCKEIYAYLETLLPISLRCAWDNDGIMVCASPHTEVFRVLTAVDITDEVIEEGIAKDVQLILSHHPLLFHPLKSVTADDVSAGKVIRLLQAGIAAFSFHTRLDAAQGGINDLLAQQLGLTQTEPFGLPDAQMGRIGIVQPTDFFAFCTDLKKRLYCSAIQYVAPKATIARVAVLGGAGKDFLSAAFHANADVFVTGEMSYDAMLSAAGMGINVIAAGHYETEQVCRTYFAQALARKFPHIRVLQSELHAPVKVF